MKTLLLIAVKSLALPPEDQAVQLQNASVDELALDFDAQPWRDEPLHVQAALDELSDLLTEMSGSQNAHL